VTVAEECCFRAGKSVCAWIFKNGQQPAERLKPNSQILILLIFSCLLNAAMPIISNTNHDFSNLSVSDDSSLDRIFTEIPETETIKGVYYQRAQFIRKPEDLVSIDHALLAVINVGGNRYTFPWTTLEQFPLTRLGRLCGCRSLEDIASVCDDYDESRKEFFFDRSPSAFKVILNFLAAGKLRLLREMCVLSLHDELNYWGVEMAYMERCCKRKMYTRIEEVHEKERREEERRQRNAMQRVPVEETKYRKVMNWLRDMVENPQSGLPGKIFACFSVIMVAVTVVSLCISTMPDLREEEDRVSNKCYGGICYQNTALYFIYPLHV
ncbi:hypothetical protein XENOCAPTIV_019406, partial [Xenoophorus captivus]